MTDSVDMVNQPPHYKSGGLEAIDVIEAFFRDNYLRGSVFKYIARAGKKSDELEDLEKAEFYLKREIAWLKRQRAAEPTVFTGQFSGTCGAGWRELSGFLDGSQFRLDSGGIVDKAPNIHMSGCLPPRGLSPRATELMSDLNQLVNR